MTAVVRMAGAVLVAVAYLSEKTYALWVAVVCATGVPTRAVVVAAVAACYMIRVKPRLGEEKNPL